MMTSIICLGTTMSATNGGGQPPVSKNEKLPPPADAGAGVSIRVLWSVAGYKVGAGAVWGKEEAEKMLFKPLDIGPAYITFDGKTCHNIEFKKMTVKADEYFYQAYHLSPQALGIGEESLEVVKTSCDLPGFAEYVQLKDRRLLIQVNGVFFYFEPAVNY
jgi:hypothetical protein